MCVKEREVTRVNVKSVHAKTESLAERSWNKADVESFVAWTEERETEANLPKG